MKEKVLKEYKELEQKIGRLKKFMYDKNNESVIGKTQWKLLNVQYVAMVQYLTVLGDRLTDLKIKY